MKLISTLALKGVLEKLALPGVELHIDATQAILPRLAKGERCDLLILTEVAMEELRKQGKVGDTRLLGSSGVGVAVRAGAPKPDISTVEAFRHAIESANSVGHSKVGASGIYFASLIEKMNLKLKKRVVVEKGPVGLAVARGEAEIGLQQLCELAPVKGIDIVGPLPAPLQVVTRFAAGIPKDSPEKEKAGKLIDLISSSRKEMIEGGMEPA